MNEPVSYGWAKDADTHAQGAFEPEEVRLELMKVGQRLSMPIGFQREEWQVMVDHMAHQFVASLTGYLLVEEGGKPIERKTHYWQKIKPWWLPKFLWRRIPEQHEVAVAVARPMWTYPQASIRVPNLGPVVMKVQDLSTSAVRDVPEEG
jgi:hypothetical protein